MHTSKTTDPLGVASAARAVHVANVPVNEMLSRVRVILEREGFAILAEIDLADLLDRRIDTHRDPLFVLEICHPKLVDLGLAVAEDAALVLLRKICVWKSGTGSAVAAVPFARASTELGRAHLAEMVADADERLDRVFAQLEIPLPAGAEPARRRGHHEVNLDDAEVETLREAARRQAAALMAEVAGTESRPLQRELATTINRLEALARKLDEEGARPSPA